MREQNELPRGKPRGIKVAQADNFYISQNIGHSSKPFQHSQKKSLRSSQDHNAIQPNRYTELPMWIHLSIFKLKNKVKVAASREELDPRD